MTAAVTDTGQTLARGSAWVAIGQSVGALSGLASSIVAARVLEPEDFGVMGIALLAIATLNALSQTGFDRALIQRKEIDGYLDVAWTVQVVRGAVLGAVILAAAWPLASFYNEPRLIPIFCVMSGSVLAAGFRNIATIVFHRSLDFRAVVALGSAKAILKLGIVLVLLFTLRSVWALVLGHLASAVLDLALSYLVLPRRPKIEWDFLKAKELVHYGKWITGMAVLGLTVTRGDDMFISKYLGMAALGLYGFAYEIANLPATNVTHVVGRVSFATYARLNDEADTDGLRRSFFQVMRATVLITAPVSALIFLSIEDVVRFVIGAKWTPIVPLVHILIVAGFVRSIAALATALFHGAGEPKLDFIMNLPRFLALTFLIWPACALGGLAGASWLSLLAVCTCLPTWYAGLSRLAGVTLQALLRENALAALSTCAAAVSYILARRLIAPDTLLLFFAQLAATALLWAAAMWLLGRLTSYRLFEEITALGRALKRKPSPQAV